MDDDEEAHRKRKAPEGDEDQAKTSGAVVNHLISSQVLPQSFSRVHRSPAHAHNTPLNKTPLRVLSFFFSQAPLTERGTSAPLTDDTVKNEATKVITTEALTEIGGSVTVLSSKGYRTARSTLVVNEGAWYFEVVVAHLGDSGHVRVGWSTNKCELNAPVGFDQHGYGYCDVSGDKVHHRNRESYGEAYAAGDVVGCYIYVKPAEGAADAGAKEFDLNTRDGVDGGAEVEDCNTRTCADDCVGNAAEASHDAEEEGGKILRADGTDDDRSAHDGAHLENKEAVGTQQAEVSDAPGAPCSSNTAAAAAGDGGCVAFVKTACFKVPRITLNRALEVVLARQFRFSRTVKWSPPQRLHSILGQSLCTRSRQISRGRRLCLLRSRYCQGANLPPQLGRGKMINMEVQRREHALVSE